MLAYGIIAEFMEKGYEPGDSQDIICEGLHLPFCSDVWFQQSCRKGEAGESEETCSFSPVILSNVNLQQLSEDATAQHDVKQIFVQSKSDLPNLTASD